MKKIALIGIILAFVTSANAFQAGTYVCKMDEERIKVFKLYKSGKLKETIKDHYRGELDSVMVTDGKWKSRGRYTNIVVNRGNDTEAYYTKIGTLWQSKCNVRNYIFVTDIFKKKYPCQKMR